MIINSFPSINSAKFNTNFSQNLCRSVSFGKSEDTFCSDFSKEKKSLIEKLKNNKLVSKEHLQEIAQAQDKEELENSIEWMAESACRKNDDVLLNCVNWEDSVKKQKTTLTLEKHLNKIKNNQFREVLSLFKTVAHKDIDPEVVKIKNNLIQNYGLKCVCLDNNLEYSKLCLESMKVLKKKNFPLPDQIILSRYLSDNGFSANIDGRPTIFLNPETEFDSWMASTESPLHCIIHEAVHCTQPDLLVFNIKKIPSRFTETVENLSTYAEGNFAQEVHAELVTKRLLDKLSPDEEELLKYLCF